MPVFNKMVYNGTEYILGGGGNIGEPLNLTVTTSGLDATIKWEDNEIGTIPPTTFQKSELVRKVGSAPTSPSDGVLVVTETVKDTYKTTGYVDQGLTDGTTYYYRVFSYSDLGGISYCDAESVTISSGWTPGANTVAYYQLETDALDQSGNGNDATWVGTASYTTVGGEASAHFAGSDYINTGVSIGSGPLTIACMFYFQSNNNYQTIVGTPILWNGAPNVGLCLLNTRCYGWTGTGNIGELGNPNISENTWHFGAIRIDGNGNVKLQIDSDLYTGTTNSFTISDSVYIGAGVGNRLLGNVKQVAIWDVSITDEELESYRQTLM